MQHEEAPRPPLPPFTLASAQQKVRAAEDAWNLRDPQRVSLAYTVDSRWRNRAEFFQGRAAIQAFLERKWAKEHDYRLIKELWAFEGHRIAVRFAYEWRDAAGQWFRAYGNENWEFDALGYHGGAPCLDQRSGHSARGSQVPLAAGPPARRSPRPQRPRAVVKPTRARRHDQAPSPIASSVGSNAAQRQRARSCASSSIAVCTRRSLSCCRRWIAASVRW